MLAASFALQLTMVVPRGNTVDAEVTVMAAPPLPIGAVHATVTGPPVVSVAVNVGNTTVAPLCPARAVADTEVGDIVSVGGVVSAQPTAVADHFPSLPHVADGEPVNPVAQVPLQVAPN